MPSEKAKLLTEEFLYELFNAAMESAEVCKVMTNCLRLRDLPGNAWSAVYRSIRHLYQTNGEAPTFGILSNELGRNGAARNLLDDIKAISKRPSHAALFNQLENYVVQVRLADTLSTAVSEYNDKQNVAASVNLLAEFVKWRSGFSMAPSAGVNVIKGWGERARQNRDRTDTQDTKSLPVTSFYIDELDRRNDGRSLRTQLSYFLASTGVGKSHIIRWIGKEAAVAGGLNVLHVQLEGSESEVVDAYSASLADGCTTSRFERGAFTDEEIEEIASQLASLSGTITVRTGSGFEKRLTVDDMDRYIQDWKKNREDEGGSLDILLIDSADLLDDRRADKNTSAYDRIIHVAQDLKDLAKQENIWIAASFQATIENKDWKDNESNVLTEYNMAGAKGASRPLSHLVTLNQTSHEKRENTMRIHVAKSRFFFSDEPFRIKTDYDHERFYDRPGTLGLPQSRK